MFPPDANVAPYDISTLATAKRARGDPKAIKHGNTRLPEQADSQSISAPPSPTRSRIDAAITGIAREKFFSYNVSCLIPFNRPSKNTSNRQLLTRPYYAFSDTLRAGS